MDNTLMLIEVATLGDGGNLEFLIGDKQGIWPSMLGIAICLDVNCFVHEPNFQVIPQMMEPQEQR